MKLRKTLFALLLVTLLLALLTAVNLPVAAEGAAAGETQTTETQTHTEENATGTKAIAAGIGIAVAAAAAAIAMGIAIARSSDAIARQPEAAEKIRSGMMLGLVFIETALIYALIVAILIIFVL